MFIASRHAAFVLGLTMFHSVFLGMPMILLACFQGLSLTLPVQIVSAFLPVQILNALRSRSHAWSLTVVLSLAAPLAYAGWLSTLSFPTESPVQPMSIFHVLLGAQTFTLVAILYQLLGLSDFTPAERLLAKQQQHTARLTQLPLFWSTLWLSSQVLVAELVIAAVQPQLNLHLLLFFSLIWPYLNMMMIFKQEASLQAIEALIFLLGVGHIAYILTIFPLQLGALWARVTASGLGAVQVVLYALTLRLSSQLQDLDPAERLASILK